VEEEELLAVNGQFSPLCSFTYLKLQRFSTISHVRSIRVVSYTYASDVVDALHPLKLEYSVICPYAFYLYITSYLSIYGWTLAAFQFLELLHTR
jgi:hypothetical protein